MLGTELRDFDSSVAVEYAEEEDFFADAVEEDRVFHILPPTCM